MSYSQWNRRCLHVDQALAARGSFGWLVFGACAELNCNFLFANSDRFLFLALLFIANNYKMFRNFFPLFLALPTIMGIPLPALSFPSSRSSFLPSSQPSVPSHSWLVTFPAGHTQGTSRFSFGWKLLFVTVSVTVNFQCSAGGTHLIDFVIFVIFGLSVFKNLILLSVASFLSFCAGIIHYFCHAHKYIFYDKFSLTNDMNLYPGRVQGLPNFIWPSLNMCWQ